MVGMGSPSADRVRGTVMATIKAINIDFMKNDLILYLVYNNARIFRDAGKLKIGSVEG